MTEFLKRAISGLLLIIWIFATISFSSILFIISMIFTLLGILFFEWPALVKRHRFLFLAYPTIPFLLIIYLQLFGYKSLNILTFAACFLFDSSSYAFGKLFGKHKITPSISPGKTVEGCIGGCLTLICTYFIYLKLHSANWTNLFVDIRNILVPLMICFLAFAGDLFESYLKRKSGLKDSGKFLPGHGGLLDRFDSILFVVVFVFLFRNYLINIF